MKLTKKLSILAIAAIGMTSTTANAIEIAGKLTNVQGEVLIERGGALLRAGENSALIPGDKVITSDNSYARIKLTQCESSLLSAQSVNVGFGNHCANIANVTRIASSNASGFQYGTLNQVGDGGASLLPVLGAVTAVGALVVIADNENNNDDVITSP